MRDGPRARPLSSAWLPLRCLPRAGFWNAKPQFSEGPGMAVPRLREGSSGPPTPVLLCSPDPGDGGPGPCPLPSPQCFQCPDSLIGTAVCLVSHSARAHPQIKQALPWTLAPVSFLSLQLRDRAPSKRPLGEE